MAQFPASDFQALFTKALIEVYKERIKPKKFLQTFFTPKVRTTKTLSIEVQRGTEKVAVDVNRHDEGNVNQWTKSTEKLFEPPYFHEKFFLTDLELYDRLFGAAPGAAIDDTMFIQMLNDAADKLDQIKDKIDRAKELMCANVFESGIVQLNAALNVDFKRKAASLVDLGGGNYWANNSDVFAQLQTYCKWLRTTGKNTSMTFDLICGETAINHFFANTVVLGRQDLLNLKLDSLSEPKAATEGSVYHGSFTAGPYRINLWSYPEFYENTSGVMVPYLNEKKVVLLPATGYKFSMGYAAVPQLLKPGQPIKTGEFIISEFTDERKKSHEIAVESAPLAIPVTVDHIVTLKVVA